MPREGLAILAGSYARFLALARWGVLPFFLDGLRRSVLLESHYFDRPTAAMSVLSFSLLPAVLAHAGLATKRHTIFDGTGR